MIKNIAKKFLIMKYSNEKNSASNISNILGCSMSTIYNRLKLYNIPKIQKIVMSDFAKKRRGINASNFKDGRYCGNKYFCIDCRNKISVETWYFGSKKCRKCGNKGINKGKKNGMFGKQTPHGKNDRYKNIYMRSSYEIKFAYFLDCSNIKWLYESKTFDLGNSTYTPDFYLPEFDCHIEIKGYWRDNARKKFRKFKRIYPNSSIQLLNYISLKKLGVI